MTNVIPISDLELRPGGTAKFEGMPHGSGASCFVVRDEPGRGPLLHVHPYPETWVILAGRVRFTIGGEPLEAAADHIVVAPANVPHKFVSLGPDRLEMVCIHPAPRIIQQDLEEPAGAI